MKNDDHEAPLPRGLHHQGAETWLIQLSRDGHRLTRRFHGSKAAALRALDDAKVELGRKQEASKNSRTSALTKSDPPALVKTGPGWEHDRRDARRGGSGVRTRKRNAPDRGEAIEGVVSTTWARFRPWGLGAKGRRSSRCGTGGGGG